MRLRKLLPLLGLLLFLCWPQSAHAAIAVTSNICSSTEASSTSGTCVLNATNLTSGSVIICGPDHGNNATGGTITDPTNGTYTSDVSQAVSGTRAIYHANNSSTAASLTVSISYTGAADTQIFFCMEVTGLATSSVFDTSASGGASSGTITTGAYTTAQANEIIVGICGTHNAGNTLSFAGFTQVGQQTAAMGSVFSYKIVSSVQTGVTTSCTNTGGVNSSVLIGTYKAVAASGGGGGFGGKAGIGGTAGFGYWNRRKNTW